MALLLQTRKEPSQPGEEGFAKHKARSGKPSFLPLRGGKGVDYKKKPSGRGKKRSDAIIYSNTRDKEIEGKVIKRDQLMLD